MTAVNLTVGEQVKNQKRRDAERERDVEYAEPDEMHWTVLTSPCSLPPSLFFQPASLSLTLFEILSVCVAV